MNYPNPEALAQVLNRSLKWCGDIFGGQSSENLDDFIKVSSKDDKLIITSKIKNSEKVFDTPLLSEIFEEVGYCVFRYIPIFLGFIDVDNVEFYEGPWYSIVISAVIYMNESDTHRKMRTARIRLMPDGSIDLLLDGRELCREIYS